MNTLNKALAGKLDSLRDVIRGYEMPNGHCKWRRQAGIISS